MAVLFGRVAAAEAFAAQLAARGVRAASVCAADGPRRRRELHRQLARGDVAGLGRACWFSAWKGDEGGMKENWNDP